MESPAVSAASKPQVKGSSAWSRLFRPPTGILRCRPTPVRCEEPATPAADAASVGGPAKADESAVQFEMFNKEWQSTSQQDNFDGFRLEMANAVTKNLQAAHTLFLGTQLRECGYIYQFGPAFQSADGKQMMVARVGLDGDVNGRFVRAFQNGITFKASSNSSLKDAQRNMYEGSAEYTGSRWTCAGKMAWQGAMLLGASATARVMPSLHVGGDLLLVLANGVTIGQLGARWAEGKDIFTCNVTRSPDPKSRMMPTSLHEFRMQYVRKVTERLSLGSEFKVTHPSKDSGMSFVYEYMFRQARVQGLLDTEGKVSCCVSDFQGFGFSGMIDYVQGDYKFGVVMHVLPQQEGQGPMM